MSNRIEQLREKHGLPSDRASKKVKDYMSDELMQFIKESPFAVLASSDNNGNCDASPRGGKPGFVKVISPTQLFVPDIKGNRLFQSFSNFESNPKAGLIFFIPDNNKMVRVNGRVKILNEEETKRTSQLEVFSADEKSELIQGFIVDVDEAYTHCPRALNFSNLWKLEKV